MTSNGRHDELVSPLGRYWDALVHGRSAEPTDLDPALAATVRHLHIDDDALGADRHFADRLLEDLMHTATAQGSMPLPDNPARLRVLDAPVGPWVLPRHDPPRPRWALTHLATAAMFVLVLGVGLVAAGFQHLRPPEPLAGLPALVATPVAERQVITETVLDDSVASLPAGHAQVLVFSTRLQPGAVSDVTGVVGRVLFKVEQGTVAITLSDGDHAVTAGETLNASTVDRDAIRNVGTDVARFIEVDLLDAVATLTEAGPEFVASGSTGVVNAWPIQAGATLPAGSARVVLERLTIPPDAEVPAFTATGLDWLGIEEGRVGVTLEGEQLPFRWDPGEERTFGVDQHPPLFAPGTRVTLRNAGDGQLILYRLTLTPTETGGSAGTPAP